MNEKSSMKRYYQQQLDQIEDQRIPVIEAPPHFSNSWEDLVGYCVTAAYLIYYFFGAQWGSIGQYLSFGIKPF